MNRNLPRAAALLSLLLLDACTSPTAPSLGSGQLAALHFQCPAVGTEAVLLRQDGSRARQRWMGVAPDDPDVCLVETPRSRHAGAPPERRLFGFVGEDYQGTGGEAEGIRTALDQILRRGAQHAEFITRFDNIQRVQQWSLAGADTLQINDRPLPVLKLHRALVNGSNTHFYSQDLWLDPVTNVFVRENFSVDYPNAWRQRSFQVVRLIPPGQTEGGTDQGPAVAPE